jgi:hypothetical protein
MKVFMAESLWLIVIRNKNGTEVSQNTLQASRVETLGAKKDGTNGLAVRAGRPVTQLTSSSGTAGYAASITGIYTRYHRFDRKQIQ